MSKEERCCATTHSGEQCRQLALMNGFCTTHFWAHHPEKEGSAERRKQLQQERMRERGFFFAYENQ